MSAKPFFVTGLPRSRTAWLSVLLTTDRSLCLHEPCALLRQVGDLSVIYGRDDYEFVGVADSALGFFAPEVIEAFSPRTVIVERDINEVERSLTQLGMPGTNYCELLLEALAEVRSHPLVLAVPFDALNDAGVVEEVYQHLMPGARLDRDRYELLAGMLVETNPLKTMAKAVENRENLTALMSGVWERLRPVEKTHAIH